MKETLPVSGLITSMLEKPPRSVVWLIRGIGRGEEESVPPVAVAAVSTDSVTVGVGAVEGSGEF